MAFCDNMEVMQMVKHGKIRNSPQRDTLRRFPVQRHFTVRHTHQSQIPQNSEGLEWREVIVASPNYF